MTTVEVLELKEDLELYLGRAREGEAVLITERGREIAQLLPASNATAVIGALARAGRVAWSGGKPTGISGIKPRGESVAAAVIEDRR